MVLLGKEYATWNFVLRPYFQYGCFLTSWNSQTQVLPRGLHLKLLYPEKKYPLINMESWGKNVTRGENVTPRLPRLTGGNYEQPNSSKLKKEPW